MTCRWRYFLALAAIAGVPAALSQPPTKPPAAAATHAADRVAVARIERRWLAAVQPGGAREALDDILADDYRDTDWQGRTRNKADLIAAPAAANAGDHVTDMQVRVWGDTAVVTGINHVHSISNGWTVEVPFTDVFARIDGRWHAVASQETLRGPAPHAQPH